MRQFIVSVKGELTQNLNLFITYTFYNTCVLLRVYQFKNGTLISIKGNNYLKSRKKMVKTTQKKPELTNSAPPLFIQVFQNTANGAQINNLGLPSFITNFGLIFC